MADVTSEPIMRIAMGFMAAKHLFTASAIGLFENLADGPATVDELAVKCGVPYQWMEAKSQSAACCAIGIGEIPEISGEGQTYAETEADEWLAQIGWHKLERKSLVGGRSQAWPP